MIPVEYDDQAFGPIYAGKGLEFWFCLFDDWCELVFLFNVENSAKSHAVWQEILTLRPTIEVGYGEPLNWSNSMIWTDLAGGPESPEEAWREIQARHTAAMLKLMRALSLAAPHLIDPRLDLDDPETFPIVQGEAAVFALENEVANSFYGHRIRELRARIARQAG